MNYPRTVYNRDGAQATIANKEEEVQYPSGTWRPTHAEFFWPKALYGVGGRSILVKDEAEYAAKAAEGYKDSPAAFEGHPNHPKWKKVNEAKLAAEDAAKKAFDAEVEKRVSARLNEMTEPKKAK